MVRTAEPPCIDEVWRCLHTVPDPEIPAVSVVDLGIVRSVTQRDGAFEVAITPTYSGCPATAVIALDIDAALRAHGFDNARVNTQIAPPWTTDWITSAGRRKLRDYGIAPPQGRADTCSGMLARGPVACPQCGSGNTTCVSAFGSTPCKAAWRCAACLEPFDYFKPI